MMLAISLIGLVATSCEKDYIDGEPELPDLPTVQNLQASASGFDVVLSWNAPATSLQIANYTVARINGQSGQAEQTWEVPADVTTFNVVGAPMGEERGYTVKVKYADGYSSTGQTVFATLPQMQLNGVSNLKAEVNRRTVTLTWTLPQSSDITGIHIYRSDDPDGGTTLTEPVTSFEMKSQPMDETLTFNVEVIYGGSYYSQPASVETVVPFVDTHMGFLLLANSVAELPDDDEQAAATWFAQLPNATFVTTDQLSSLDPEVISVL